MGLAGRKQKQRIPADPRNLSWADDASRFGHSYLSKFGWDVSQGLGSSGDGMKTHIKVQQKLDMMGIGAQHQRDPNSIAWKQNKEFEALLKRLNESAEQGKGADAEDAEGEGEDGRERKTAMGNVFARAQEKVGGKPGNQSSVTTKKRKHKDRDDPDTSDNTRKKRKDKHQNSSSDDSDSAALALDCASEPPSTLSLSGAHPEPIPKPHPMAHRARIRAATRIAGKPAAAISEILGIAPSSSVSTSTSTSTPAPTPTPTPTPPSTSTPVPQSPSSLDNMTTSIKSVADYFREKLLARSSSSSIPASSSSSSSGSATPGLGAGLGPRLSNVPLPDDDREPPRRGIGSRAPIVNTDGQDMFPEKQRRKAERKAEKRKRREAEASQATAEGVSTDVKEQVEVDDVENIQRTSKKDKKVKKSREREQQAPADQSNDNDDIIEKGHEDDTLSGSLPEPSKKSKKEPKNKRS